jgi:hypothetical protein
MSLIWREMEPDGRRQVLPRQASETRGVAGVAEVCVSVDVHQAEATSTAQPERGTQQDAAVAAQDQNALAGIHVLADTPAKPARVVDQRGLVPDRTRVEVGQIATREDHTCLASAHAPKMFLQPCLAKCCRRLVGTRNGAGLGRTQAQVRGSLDHRELRRGRWLLRLHPTTAVRHAQLRGVQEAQPLHPRMYPLSGDFDQDDEPHIIDWIQSR